MKGVTFDQKEKYAQIEVSVLLYPKEVIEDTVREFKNVCDFKIDQTDESIRINFTPRIKIPVKPLAYEFMNHLLANLKNVRGVM